MIKYYFTLINVALLLMNIRRRLISRIMAIYPQFAPILTRSKEIVWIVKT